MKKALTTIFCIALALCFMTSASFAAAKREKFGSDPRHDVAKRVKFKTSDEKVRWKMVMPWSKGLLFYDIAVHFADSVRLASAGRLDIKPFSAGELVPAMQSLTPSARVPPRSAMTGPATGRAKTKPSSPLPPYPSDWMPKATTSGYTKKADWR
jgi:hypothetical protein